MRWWLSLLLLLILLAALKMRSLHLSEPLWIDELHTGWCVAGDWSELPERAAMGNQSPLYFAETKLVSSILGSSAFSLRLTSLISSLLLVMAAAGCVGWVTRSPLALLATGVLLACDADAMFFATEARPYAVLMLVTPVHLALAWWRVRPAAGSSSEQDCSKDLPPRKYELAVRLGWTLSAALMVHLHYTALLILAVEAVVILVFASIRQRWTRRWAMHWGVDAALLSLMLLPLLGQMLDVGKRRGAWSAFVSGSWDQAFPLIRLGLMGLALPLVGVGLDRLWRSALQRWAPAWGRVDQRRAVNVTLSAGCWFALLALGTWGLAAVLTLGSVAPVLLVRYLVGTIPLVAIAAGLLVGRISGPWLRLVIAGSLMLWASTGREFQTWWVQGQWPPARIEGWDRAVARLNQEAPDDWPVLLFGGLIEDRQLATQPTTALADYCRFPLNSTYPLVNAPSRVTPTTAAPRVIVPANFMREAVDAGGCWVIVRDHPTEPRVLWLVLGELNARLATIDARFTIDLYAEGAVHVVKIRRLRE